MTIFMFKSSITWLIFSCQKRKLAIEVDELGNEDRKQNKENKRQKELDEHLKRTFIRINADEKDFSAYDGLDRVQAFCW